MAGSSEILILLFLLSVACFQGRVSGQTCYSCNSATATQTASCSANSVSVSNTATLTCQNGCYTNMSVITGASTSSVYVNQVTRGCATSSFTSGCTYDSSIQATICSNFCTSDYCNGAVKEVDIGCYYCNPSNTDNCQSVTSNTGVTTCQYQSCSTTTTYNTDQSILEVQLGCGIYPTAYNFTYTNAQSQKVVYSQCNSSFCNSGTAAAPSTSSSGVQCYSCSYYTGSSDTNCGTLVNTDSVGTVSCPSGSCSTLTMYYATFNQLQSITRGCGQSSCLSTGCMTSGSQTACWSTCQSSNCNGNVTNTARPDSGSCNNAPGISGKISTLWCLLTLVAMFLRF